MNKQKCVIVLGMHRSGTSALAGVLNLLGVDFGNNLMPATDYNEKGYFESLNIYRINKSILKQINGSWDSLEGFPLNWMENPEVIDYKKELKDFIKTEFKNSAIFGIKDPVISLLLPIYLDIFKELKIEPILMVTERKGIEIARSLSIRDNLSLKKSLSLIKRYKQNIDYHTRGYNLIRINFDDLINNLEKTLNLVSSSLNINLDYKSKNNIINFISPKLKHHNLSYDEYISELADLLERKDKMLVELGNDINSYTNRINEKDSQLSNLFNRINEKDSQLSSLIRQIKIKDKKILSINSVLSLNNFKLNELMNLLKEKENLLFKINSESENKDKMIADLQKNILEINSHVNNLQSIINSTERSLTFKTLKKYQKLIDVIMPTGTSMRKIYNRFIYLNQIFINEGFAGIKKKNKILQINNSPQKMNLDIYWNNFCSKYGNLDILFVNHEETRTGAPKILFEVAKKSKEEYNIAIVSKKLGTMHSEFSEEFPDIIYPEKIYSNSLNQEVARDILLNTKPRLVYVNSIASYEYASEAKKLGFPVIFHVHELEDTFKEHFSSEQLNNFNNIADKFIAVSDKVYNYLLKIGCKKSKIVKINEFIDVELIRKKSNEKSLGEVDVDIFKEKNEVIITSIGTCSLRKGTDILIDAFNLVKKNKNLKFIWIGDNESYISPFSYKMKDLGKNFLFLGEKTNPYPYIKNSDIFVLPSREDPFPLSVLEAMSLGKPIITFKDSGGASEAMKDCGLILKKTTPSDLSEGILKLSENKSLRDKYSKNSLKYCEKYNSPVVMPRINTLIKKFFNNFYLKKDPFVSVIIPSYNYGWCISQAINSILNQTYKNLEIIIVDDFSTDDSIEIINSYVKKYPKRIKLLNKRLEDKGIAGSYKIGINNAAGDYVTFLEADDTLDKDSIKSRLEVFRDNPGVIFAFNGIKLFGPDKVVLSKKKKVFENHFRGIEIPQNKPFDAFLKLSNRNIVSTFSAVMVRRSALLDIDFNNKYEAWFDWWFNAQLSLRGKFFYLPLKKTNWRIHNKSFNYKYINEVDVGEKSRIMREAVSNLKPIL